MTKTLLLFLEPCPIKKKEPCVYSNLFTVCKFNDNILKNRVTEGKGIDDKTSTSL